MTPSNHSIPERKFDLGRIANDVHDVGSRMREIAAIALGDGIEFNLDSIRAETIREGNKCQGIRVKLIGFVGRSENVNGLDISFGDAISPALQTIQCESPTSSILYSPRRPLRGAGTRRQPAGSHNRDSLEYIRAHFSPTLGEHRGHLASSR